MKARNSIILLCLLIALAFSTYGAIPRTMNYQAKLTDSLGVAIHDADRVVAFLLYDTSTGGTLLWAETLTVNISKGLFDVQLGTTRALSLPFNNAYWIQLKVDQNDDGDVTDGTDEFLEPREKLAPVAYAHRAIYADSAAGGGGTTVYTTVRLSGDGSSGNPLDIAQQGAATGNVLTWGGTSWAPAPSSGGENNYVSNATFSTGTGDLTLYREGLSALVVDLDGRYLRGTENNCWTNAGSYIYPNITSSFRIETDGDLDLNGRNIEQVDELSANTLDPVLKIGGRLYRTWTLDVVGQRVEVVGTAELDDRGYFEIDLSNRPEASDLWLFYNSVDPATIIPFVTPQAPANLYAKVDGEKFIVGSSDNTGNISFSYRLIGVRYDFRDMTPEETNRRTKVTNTYIDIDSGARYGEPEKSPNRKIK